MLQFLHFFFLFDIVRANVCMSVCTCMRDVCTSLLPSDLSILTMIISLIVCDLATGIIAFEKMRHLQLHPSLTDDQEPVSRSPCALLKLDFPSLAD